jgi:hypothetical protein
MFKANDHGSITDQSESDPIFAANLSSGYNAIVHKIKKLKFHEHVIYTKTDDNGTDVHTIDIRFYTDIAGWSFTQ